MSLEVAIREGIRESFKESFKERRGRLEIIADVLLVARRGAKKTQIVYKANLNFKMVEKYLPYLEGKGLIENTCREYTTTEKGKKYLRVYKEMEEQLA
jgi:predicted transcriptional regulator